MWAGIEFCLLRPLVVCSSGTALPVWLGDPGHQQDRTGGRRHGPAEYQREPDTSHRGDSAAGDRASGGERE
jgi:hypothetical protein